MGGTSSCMMSAHPLKEVETELLIRKFLNYEYVMKPQYKLLTLKLGWAFLVENPLCILLYINVINMLRGWHVLTPWGEDNGSIVFGTLPVPKQCIFPFGWFWFILFAIIELASITFPSSMNFSSGLSNLKIQVLNLQSVGQNWGWPWEPPNLWLMC